MRHYLIDFLKALEQAVPPPAKCHHAITYAQYGSDSDGWEDRLAVQVNCAGTFYCLFLDKEDFDSSPVQLAATCKAFLESSNPNVQFGVALGQYLS